MEKQSYRKSLDLQKNGVQWSVDLKKNDANSRKIVISLTDGGKTFNLDENMIVTVYAKKPDENIIYSNCSIESGLVIFEPKKQCISAEGTVNCELRIYSENSSGSQLLTSPRFNIEVYGVLSNEEYLVSTNEYSALTEATLKAQEATVKANDIADEITQKLENGEFKGEKGEQGPPGERGNQGIPGTTDYTALQNLPRTLCSGTLELTKVTDGGYEASGVTSVTYNGVEKFRLDKGNLLFLKGTKNEEDKDDKVVNIQTGYGCYCIDNISEKVDKDWTDYFGATIVDVNNFRNEIKDTYQAKIKCGNGIDIVGRQHTLSLQNGSTVFKKADMSTVITESGRYDIAESGDMLIGFPGITDFTPFTLKVNKSDIIKLLFDVEKNVTDVLYIGDISQNCREVIVNGEVRKGFYKNPFFDITSFELSVNADKKAYTESTVDTCDNYTNFGFDLIDTMSALNNIPHSHHRLIASTSAKDEYKNPIYKEVTTGNGLALYPGEKSSTLNIVPAQLNLSEAQVTFTDPSDNTDITLSFRELISDNIIPSLMLTGCCQKIINNGIEEDSKIMSAKGWYVSFDGSFSDKIIEPVTKQEVPIDYYVAMGDQFFVVPYTANDLHHIDYINIRLGDTSGNFAILYRKIAFNDNNEKVIDETIDLLSSAEKSEKLIASINNLESNKLFYSQGIDEVTGLPKLQAVTIGNGLKFENGVLSIE